MKERRVTPILVGLCAQALRTREYGSKMWRMGMRAFVHRIHATHEEEPQPDAVNASGIVKGESSIFKHRMK